MNVTLTPEMEQVVREGVESGFYASPDDMIDDALRLLLSHDRERTEWMRREIQVGLDQLNRGEYREYNSESLKARFEEIRAEGLRRLQAKRGA